MQRRAAAVYVAFFLVVGAVSFSLVATASAPHLSFENPEHELTEGDTFTVDGQQYTVAAITAEMEGGGGGGHGGGGQAHLVRSGTIEYTNHSARYTVEWANGSTVTYDGQEWIVLVEGANDSSFTLRETIDRAAILANDSTVENETTVVDGTTYVVKRASENGSRELIPADEYFPAPETREYAVGDELTGIENNTATVASVGADGVILEYFAPRTTEISVADEANVTVGGTTYFAHFPDNSTMVLTRNFEAYDAHQAASRQHTTLTNGLWGVTILSGLTAFFMIGLAYLPSRY